MKNLHQKYDVNWDKEATVIFGRIFLYHFNKFEILFWFDLVNLLLHRRKMKIKIVSVQTTGLCAISKRHLCHSVLSHIRPNSFNKKKNTKTKQIKSTEYASVDLLLKLPRLTFL